MRPGSLLASWRFKQRQTAARRLTKWHGWYFSGTDENHPPWLTLKVAGIAQSMGMNLPIGKLQPLDSAKSLGRCQEVHRASPSGETLE